MKSLSSSTSSPLLGQDTGVNIEDSLGVAGEDVVDDEEDSSSE
jgi:hypothetical protein